MGQKEFVKCFEVICGTTICGVCVCVHVCLFVARQLPQFISDYLCCSACYTECHQSLWCFFYFDQDYSRQCWWHCRYVISSGVWWKVSMWAQRLSQLQGSPGQIQWFSGHQEPWHSSWLACGWCKAHCGCWSLDEHQRGCLWNCSYQFGSPCCLWQESRKKGMRRCVGQRWGYMGCGRERDQLR